MFLLVWVWESGDGKLVTYDFNEHALIRSSKLRLLPLALVDAAVPEAASASSPGTLLVGPSLRRPILTASCTVCGDYSTAPALRCH